MSNVIRIKIRSVGFLIYKITLPAKEYLLNKHSTSLHGCAKENRSKGLFGICTIPGNRKTLITLGIIIITATIISI